MVLSSCVWTALPLLLHLLQYPLTLPLFGQYAQVQVRLLAACCPLLKSRDSASVQVALRAAGALLTVPKILDVEVGVDNPDQLATSLREQVADSGMLLLLPEFCMLAAQQLTAASAAAAAAAGCSYKQSGSRSSHSTSSSSSSSSSRSQCAPDPRGALALQDDVCTAKLVLMLYAMGEYWSFSGSSIQVATCVESVTRLTLVALNYLICLAQKQPTQQQQQQQQQSQGSTSSFQLTRDQTMILQNASNLIDKLVKLAFINLAASSSSSLTNMSQFWLHTFLQFNGYAVAQVAVRPLVQQYAASLKRAGAAAGAQQQQQQCRDEQEALPCCSPQHGWLPAHLAPLVPAPVSRLLQQLQYSKELVLWGAYEWYIMPRWFHGTNHEEDWQNLMYLHRDVATLAQALHPSGECGVDGQQTGLGGLQVAAQDRLLCWLIADVLLHWLATGLQRSKRDSCFPTLCITVVDLADDAQSIAAWAKGPAEDCAVAADTEPPAPLGCVRIEHARCFATRAISVLTHLCEQYRKQEGGAASSSAGPPAQVAASSSSSCANLLEACVLAPSALCTILSRSVLGLCPDTDAPDSGDADPTAPQAAASRSGEAVGPRGDPADRPSHVILVPGVCHTAQSAGQLCMGLQDVVRVQFEISQDNRSSSSSAGSSGANWDHWQKHILKSVHQLLLETLVDPIIRAAPADPCSSDHLQLYGLLCSLVKLGCSNNSLRLQMFEGDGLLLPEVVCIQVMGSVTAVLEAAVGLRGTAAEATGATDGTAATTGSGQGAGYREQPQAQGPWQGNNSSSSSSRSCSSSSSTSTNSDDVLKGGLTTQVPPTPGDLVALSPWLWLWGKCCRELAAAIRREAGSVAAADTSVDSCCSNDSVELPHELLMVSCCIDGMLWTALAALQSWLSQPSHASQAGAAGFDVPALRERLTALKEAADAASLDDACIQPATALNFSHLLGDVGSVLCLFAHPRSSTVRAGGFGLRGPGTNPGGDTLGPVKGGTRGLPPS
jgi:hypothetical protein